VRITHSILLTTSSADGGHSYYVRIAPHAMLTVLFADWFLQLTQTGSV